MSKLATQIGGKYDTSNAALFTLKKALQGIGISVRHPLGDALRKTADGRWVAYDPTWRFIDVELDYYRSIRACSFHSVANYEQGREGYIGESASLEVAYAIACEKPVLFWTDVLVNANVDRDIQHVVNANLARFHVLGATCSGSTFVGEIQKASTAKPQYQLSDSARSMIVGKVRRLLFSVRKIDG